MVSVSSGNKHRDTTCPLISWGHGGGEGDMETLEGMRRRTGRQVLGTFVECCALCGLLEFLLALILWGYPGYEGRLPFGRQRPKGA